MLNYFMSYLKPIALISLAAGIVAHAQAEIFVFTDRALYLDALNTMGYTQVNEGFENDAVWGGVRSTITGGNHTAPSITNHGITWTSNNAVSQVTTSNGAARSGSWGFYSLPHGQPPTIGDGFIGHADETIFGVGGFIRTNTPPAGISLWLDKESTSEVQIDFGAAASISTGYHYFGVIKTDGFTRFDYLETEFDIDEQKYIFADDFSFAKAPVPEPMTMTVLGLGLLGLMKRKKK